MAGGSSAVPVEYGCFKLLALISFQKDLLMADAVMCAGSPAFEAARSNFIASEAGYAIASFLLQVGPDVPMQCACASGPGISKSLCRLLD
jgi:hypothetical protein